LYVSSGIIFALFDNFWILLFGAVVGVISVVGGDFGPFRAIEESILSQLTTPESRSDVLSWYVTCSSFGSSIGTEVSGRIVQHLLERWTPAQAYHSVFWMYSGMGIVNLILVSCLSKNCELPKESHMEESEILLEDGESKSDDGEDESSLTTIPVEDQKQKPKSHGFFAVKHFLAEISAETRSIMYKLWFLLAIDSLADGMTSYSLTNYYMDQKFHLPKSTLGDITSVSYFLASLSTIFAAPLARRIGLLNTMVFTHVPSSAAVLIFPLASNVPMTVILFLIRVGLNNMEQALAIMEAASAVDAPVIIQASRGARSYAGDRFLYHLR